MTPEREARIRDTAAAFIALMGRGSDADPATSIVDLLAEIDRLRALPVIATCGECGHTPSRYARPRVCQHPALFDREDPVPLTVEHADVPPAGCPLRGGAR